MAIEVISDKEGSFDFILTDANPSIANSIRRAILGEVPTLAIEEVEFLEQTSSLYDEILAHRLSLIPIVTDLELLNFREDCKCQDGCPSCQVEFSLKKKGPGTVYSQDLKSSNKTLSPVAGIPLVKLGKAQKIELRATATLGRGKDNAKWQPAIVGYKFYPLIEISKECNLCSECVDACPKDILIIKKDKLKVTDEKECILCKSCVEACESGDITVKGDETRFIYEMESTGDLKPKKILEAACDVLIKKSEELKSKL
jgi:DNA-directed RNA polymerase subunit D